MAREIKDVQNYQDRLLKLIPSEIIAAYLFLQGIIPTENARWGTTIIAAILCVMTPLYLRRLQRVKRPAQIIVTTTSFIVWVYSLGGPFHYWGIYEAWLGSAILVLWTMVVPLIVNPKPKGNPA